MQSDLDFSKIVGFKSESVDLNKFDKQSVKIENVEVLQVPSDFTELDEQGNHHKQWILKVGSVVLETLGEEDKKIEFRASELFNLMQNKKGELIGFPTGDKSNLGKFLKDLKIDPSEMNLKQLIDAIKGKDILVRSYDKDVLIDGKANKRTYLKFRYYLKNQLFFYFFKFFKKRGKTL